MAVLCNVRPSRMDVIAAISQGAAVSSWTAPLSIYGRPCASMRAATISTGLTASCMQPRR